MTTWHLYVICHEHEEHSVALKNRCLYGNRVHSPSMDGAYIVSVQPPKRLIFKKTHFKRAFKREKQKIFLVGRGQQQGERERFLFTLHVDDKMYNTHLISPTTSAQAFLPPSSSQFTERRPALPPRNSFPYPFVPGMKLVSNCQRDHKGSRRPQRKVTIPCAKPRFSK